MAEIRWVPSDRLVEGRDEMMGLDKFTERESAILAHAHLDLAMGALLRSRFVDQIDSQVTDPGFALGTLMGKAQVACAFGLIPKELSDNLLAINDIRNAFAHDPYIRSFEDTLNVKKAKPAFEKLSIIANYMAILKKACTDPSVIISEIDRGVPDSLTIADKIGYIFFEVRFDQSTLGTKKDRFLVAAQLCWAIIFGITPTSEPNYIPQDA